MNRSRLYLPSRYLLYKVLGFGQLLFLSIPFFAGLSLYWAEKELGKQE